MGGKIHVLHVLPGGTQGGGATLVFQLIEAFWQDSAFKISLITEPASYAESKAKAMGIEVYTVHMMRSRFSRATTRQLRTLFSELKPAIIHSHGSRAGFYCACAGANKFARFIYAVHGYHFVIKPFFLLWVAIWFERFTHRAADVVTNDSYNEYELAKIEKLIPKGKPHYAALLGISPHLKTISDPLRYNQKHVAFLGRLSPEKRPEFCLEIFARLAPLGYRLTFIGGGPLQPQIETVIAQNGWEKCVTCTGMMSHEEAVKLLHDKSVLVLPSKAEGLGLAVLEGYAYGIPAVGAWVHGIKEVIQDGVTGRTMREQDPKAYADAIIDIHQAPDYYQRLVAAGQVMLETYSHEKYIVMHRHLYSLLGTAR